MDVALAATLLNFEPATVKRGLPGYTLTTLATDRHLTSRPPRGLTRSFPLAEPRCTRRGSLADGSPAAAALAPDVGGAREGGRDLALPL